MLQIAAAIDAGKVMNPLGFTGQIEGGTAQGIGFALTEELVLQDGAIRNPSFTDYLIPTILDAPQVVTVAIEEPDEGAPYGLKGIGEAPTVVSTATVVAALRDATGRELEPGTGEPRRTRRAARPRRDRRPAARPRRAGSGTGSLVSRHPLRATRADVTPATSGTEF